MFHDSGSQNFYEIVIYKKIYLYSVIRMYETPFLKLRITEKKIFSTSKPLKILFSCDSIFFLLGLSSIVNKFDINSKILFNLLR